MIEKFIQNIVALKLEKKLPLGNSGTNELSRYKIDEKSIKSLFFKKIFIPL